MGSSDELEQLKAENAILREFAVSTGVVVEAAFHNLHMHRSVNAEARCGFDWDLYRFECRIKQLELEVLKLRSETDWYDEAYEARLDEDERRASADF